MQILGAELPRACGVLDAAAGRPAPQVFRNAAERTRAGDGAAARDRCDVVAVRFDAAAGETAGPVEEDVIREQEAAAHAGGTEPRQLLAGAGRERNTRESSGE